MAKEPIGWTPGHVRGWHGVNRRRDNRQRTGPEAYLTPTACIGAGSTIAAASMFRVTDAMFGCVVTLGAAAQGLIYSQGSGGVGALVGLNSARQLVARFGDGSGSPSNNYARTAVPAPYVPRGLVHLAWAFSLDRGVVLWIDGVIVGRGSISGATSSWADNVTNGFFMSTSPSGGPIEAGLSDVSGGFSGITSIGPLRYYAIRSGLS